LAGVGAYLWEYKGGVRRKLTEFLIPRGLLLIGLQAVRVVSQLIAPNHQSSLDVLWCIGVSMILLALVAHVSRGVLFCFSVVILAGYGLPAAFGMTGHDSLLWQLLASSPNFDFIGGTSLFNRFPILPWFGMMLLGYATGHLFTLSSTERQRICLTSAMTLGALFIVLRILHVDGYQPGWFAYPEAWQTVASFLNILKYPPSLYFSIATFCQIFALIFLMDVYALRSELILRFGSASLFIYILHIPVCKMFARGASALSNILGWPVPREMLFSLPSVYVLASLALVGMYPLVVFYANLKRTHRHIKVLSYL
jgi:uncharacterized membrane protein